MIHLTEDMILAVRDREPVADEALAHLDECGACARALEEARSRAGAVEQALAALAVPLRRDVRVEEASGAEPGGVAEVAAGAESAEVVSGRGRRDSVRGTRARGTIRTVRWLGRAAVLVLIGVGALSALPGPFNGWIPRMFSRGPAPVAPTAPEPEPPGQVGGRMEVVSGPVLVRLENVVPGAVIDVRRVVGRAVGVLAATGSEFSYGNGEVRAAVVAGSVTVELPDGVVPVTLIVNGTTYLVVDAAGIEVPGPATVAVGESLVTFEVPN